MLTEEGKKQILAWISELLNDPDVTVRMVRSVKDTTKPTDQWTTYKPGHGRRCYIEIPCKQDEFYNVSGE